jgi:hypothetical protein
MIKIPDGYRQLNPDEPVMEGDQYDNGFYWVDSSNKRYIRKMADNETSFKIGDKVIVGGKTGTIHSPRMYLITDYGYLVKFNELFDMTNWGFTGIAQKKKLLAFRESLIKLVPKTKKVKLNADCSAEIFNDKVVVGCQTIPYSVIQEIVKAHDSI